MITVFSDKGLTMDGEFYGAPHSLRQTLAGTGFTVELHRNDNWQVVIRDARQNISGCWFNFPAATSVSEILKKIKPILGARVLYDWSSDSTSR